MVGPGKRRSDPEETNSERTRRWQRERSYVIGGGAVRPESPDMDELVLASGMKVWVRRS